MKQNGRCQENKSNFTFKYDYEYGPQACTLITNNYFKIFKSPIV